MLSPFRKQKSAVIGAGQAYHPKILTKVPEKKYLAAREVEAQALQPGRQARRQGQHAVGANGAPAKLEGQAAEPGRNELRQRLRASIADAAVHQVEAQVFPLLALLFLYFVKAYFSAEILQVSSAVF